ncbi:tetratricopeptide repeat protein [Photobacterium minamisatsumaniensis]|uniref:tetratricopeptide repeat protein n=1 Tax=Photobacterium minamisatsumaniensis TaxID=2910233 RepID=UPI003D151701
MKKSLAILTSIALLSSSVFASDNVVTSPSNSQVAVQKASAEHIQQLVYTAQDKRQGDDIRADALRQLARYPNQSSLVAVARALKDESATIREAAVIGTDPYQFEHRWRIVAPLLQDSSSRVRITATTSLIRDYSSMSSEQQNAIEPAYQELLTYLKSQPDTDSVLLLADVYRWHQEWGKAQTLYENLLVKTPNNVQVWLSVADNLRAQGKDTEALNSLGRAIELQPQAANLHYSKALTLVRLDKKAQAAAAIEKAAKLAEDNSYFWYLNGVLQEPIDIAKSVQSFEQAYLISGAPEQLYAVCDIYVRTNNDQAEQCLAQLEEIAPAYVIEKLKYKQG